VRLTLYSSVLIIPVLVCWFSAIVYLKGTRRIATSADRLAFLTAFVLYLLAVAHFTVFPIRVLTGDWKRDAHFHEVVNLIPFRDVDRADFILNVMLTIPLGAMLPVVLTRARSLRFMAFVAVATGTVLETNQYLMRVAFANDRNVNANDVVSNGTGVILGYLLFKFAMEDPPLRELVDRFSPARPLLRTSAKGAGHEKER
jgi:glycopeptide antibiotics resistance protein